jgi:hypothetical protein
VPKFVADSSVSPTGLKWAVDPVADVVTTAGDLLYATAADTVTRLGIGTASQVLAVNSGATAPEWVTPAAGGGKVLQVINATHSTEANSSSSSYADTGLTATITPTLATSKVLVLVSQNGMSKDTGDTRVGLRLLRTSTTLITFEAYAAWTGNGNNNGVGGSSASYLDSPATTSATTYKTQFASLDNVTKVNIQRNSSTSTITLIEIGA